MANPTVFNAKESIKEVHEKEKEINDLEKRLSALIYDVQEMRKNNAANISIPWKDSIKDCLYTEKGAPDYPNYFLKTPAFISNCVAWTYGVELTRDIKNKIASTLSFMFKEGAVGRIQHNGKTYYGLPQFFKDDLVTIKKEFQNKIAELAA